MEYLPGLPPLLGEPTAYPQPLPWPPYLWARCTSSPVQSLARFVDGEWNAIPADPALLRTGLLTDHWPRESLQENRGTIVLAAAAASSFASARTVPFPAGSHW